MLDEWAAIAVPPAVLRQGFGPSLRLGCVPRTLAAFVAMKAAMDAARSTRNSAVRANQDDFEPHHASSPTEEVLQDLQLHGWRSCHDEPDPRPLPEPSVLVSSIADMFDALVVALADTRLEPDL